MEKKLKILSVLVGVLGSMTSIAWAVMLVYCCPYSGIVAMALVTALVGVFSSAVCGAILCAFGELLESVKQITAG